MRFDSSQEGWGVIRAILHLILRDSLTHGSAYQDGQG